MASVTSSSPSKTRPGGMRTTSSQPGQRVRVAVQVRSGADRRQGDGSVHGPGIEETPTQPVCQSPRHRALAGPGGSVDRDDALHEHVARELNASSSLQAADVRSLICDFLEFATGRQRLASGEARVEIVPVQDLGLPEPPAEKDFAAVHHAVEVAQTVRSFELHAQALSSST